MRVSLCQPRGWFITQTADGGWPGCQAEFELPPVGEAGAEGLVFLCSSSALSPKALQAMNFLGPLTGLKTREFLTMCSGVPR